MRVLLIVCSGWSAWCAAGDGLPPLQVRERAAPWGTVVLREQFYEKDGQRVRHGLDETFSTDGKLLSRSRYAHGEPDGVVEVFYEGLGTKQQEMS